MIVVAMASACESDPPAETSPAEGSERNTESPPADEAADPSEANAATPSAGPGDGPGLPRGVLALQPGQSRDDIDALLREPRDSGLVTVETSDERRTLGETEVAVTTMTVDAQSSGIDELRLTFFDDQLVGVLTAFDAPQRARGAQLRAEHGDAMGGQGWRGWWSPNQDRIYQLRENAKELEVFDLGVASASIPDIRMVMLERWVTRYGAPPPWVHDAQPPGQ